LIISRSFLLRMRNVSAKFVEKIKEYNLRSITFFNEERAVYEIMIVQPSSATDDSTAQEHCMLDTDVYK